MTNDAARPTPRVPDALAMILLLVAGLAVLGACSPAAAPASSGKSAPAPLVYDVVVDPGTPSILRASIDLSAHHGTGRTVQARGVHFGLEPQVHQPRCGAEELPAKGPGEWALPDDCRLLDWTIRLEEARPNGVDPSRQASLYFSEGGWWLLSEPTSLLRVTPSPEGSELLLRIHHPDNHAVEAGAVWADDEEGWHMPPMESAPEFYVFGDLELRRLKLGPTQVTYVIDDLSRFDRLPLAEAHASALSYLSRVVGVPPDLPERDRHLLVVWLGIDEDEGHVGGAAGSRSFLANYVDGKEETLELNAAQGMALLAHEQFHQLQDLIGLSGPPWPVWLGEGLAHYYGLKAMARGPFSREVIALVRDRFVDPGRPVDVGLPEWGRRHAEGDPSAYPMFYLQGATFWAEVDRVLMERGPRNEGLDALIPELVRTTVPGPGLPGSFRMIILDRGGEAMARVLERYLEG